MAYSCKVATTDLRSCPSSKNSPSSSSWRVLGTLGSSSTSSGLNSPSSSAMRSQVLRRIRDCVRLVRSRPRSLRAISMRRCTSSFMASQMIRARGSTPAMKSAQISSKAYPAQSCLRKRSSLPCRMRMISSALRNGSSNASRGMLDRHITRSLLCAEVYLRSVFSSLGCAACFVSPSGVITDCVAARRTSSIPDCSLAMAACPCTLVTVPHFVHWNTTARLVRFFSWKLVLRHWHTRTVVPSSLVCAVAVASDISSPLVRAGQRRGSTGRGAARWRGVASCRRRGRCRWGTAHRYPCPRRG